MRSKINVIYGATASGKTSHAVQLAKSLDGEIINCDSMQVYQELPILTAQPTAAEKEAIVHKLYGYISCKNQYSAGQWLYDAVNEIKKTFSSGKTPILVGGTGMYIKCLMEGISEIPKIPADYKTLYENTPTPMLYERLAKVDPVLFDKYKAGDRQRIIRALEVFDATGTTLSKWQQNTPTQYFPADSFNLIYIERNRDELYRRINERFDHMVELGAVEEVRKLHSATGNIVLPRACGLPELIAFLNGDITLKEAIEMGKQSSRNYAKRQLTWARNQFKKRIESYG